MSTTFSQASHWLKRLLGERDVEALGEALRPKPEAAGAPALPRDLRVSPALVRRRWALLGQRLAALGMDAEGIGRVQRTLLDADSEAGMRSEER
ncbi:MAG: hypothetical protein RBR73_07410, partial [Halothiobacillaceae bacterium]|nr:hypothetical protein [Halothiobacillaceae bacterium]